MSYIVSKNGKAKTQEPDAVDKAMALIFLQEALITEDYEGCPALIAAAKRCGARSREITRILARSPRRVTGRA